MGYHAAHNIYQHMKAAAAAARGVEEEPEDIQLNEFPPVIGIAIGKKAVGYWKEAGVMAGEKELKDFFGDDLGFTSKYFLSPVLMYSWNVMLTWAVCWNHLGLGGDKTA